jgi:magnesium transporter
MKIRARLKKLCVFLSFNSSIQKKDAMGEEAAKSYGQIIRYNNETLDKFMFETPTFLPTFSFDKEPEDQTSWLNVYTIDELGPIEQFCKESGFNALVFQNIKEMDIRPLFEDFGDYLYFSIRSAVPTAPDAYKFNQEQLSFILGKNYLFSIQQKPADYFGIIRDRIDKNKGIIREKGADFLLYKLLDAIADNYFKAVDASTDIIEELDLKVNKTSNPIILSTIELQKRKLMELRRIVLPMKEMATSLESSKSHLFNKETHHYFSDLKNSCISILEEIESNKNALDGLTNLYYAVQGQRMNEIMKVLTIVSTIFIPLTFIVGVYGMNFKYMPELEWAAGYFVTWGAMIFITLALLYYFRKKGWI